MHKDNFTFTLPHILQCSYFNPNLVGAESSDHCSETTQLSGRWPCDCKVRRHQRKVKRRT